MKRSSFACALTAATALLAVCGTVVHAQVPIGGTSDSAASMAAMLKPTGKPTPHMPDGHPDLNGTWQVFVPGGGGPLGRLAVERDAKGSVRANFGMKAAPNFDVQPAWPPNQPVYKPEFKQKVIDLDAHESTADSVYGCGQPGLPRIGAPQKILQNSKEIVFLYADLAGQVWRIIPFNRKSLPTDTDSTRYGDSMASWQGDTLVIDTGNFDTVTWFWEYGDFHSSKMHVRETLRRDGPRIIYQATVTDPDVLQQPWVHGPRILVPANEEIFEQPACTPTDPARAPVGHHNQRFS